MAAERSNVLAEVELELMDVIWEQREATAQSVQRMLRSRRRVTNSTIRTMLRILERKGYLKHRVEGRARMYVYEPVIDREEATRRIVRHLADRISGGSTNLLVQRILEVEGISAEEVEEIRRKIEERAKEQKEEG